MAKNIEINIASNNNGNYETLYPKCNLENVVNNLAMNYVSGNLNWDRVDNKPEFSSLKAIRVSRIGTGTGTVNGGYNIPLNKQINTPLFVIVATEYTTSFFPSYKVTSSTASSYVGKIYNPIISNCALFILGGTKGNSEKEPAGYYGNSTILGIFSDADNNKEFNFSCRLSNYNSLEVNWSQYGSATNTATYEDLNNSFFNKANSTYLWTVFYLD